MTISIGIIGCGRIARAVHLPTLMHLPGVRVIALADSSPDARNQAQKICKDAAVFDNYKTLLKLPNLDAVLIALPPALHADAAVAAFEHGKHVYLEKPLAESLTAGQKILAAWRASGKVGQIGFNYRFNPLHMEARAMIQGGKIGSVYGVRTLFFSEGHAMPEWLHHAATGGSALHELASHHFDLLPYALNQPIVSVQATIRTVTSDNDWAAVTLQLAGGAQAQSFFAMGQAQDDRLEYYGATGKLLIDRFRSLSIEHRENTDVTPRLRRLRQTLKAIVRSRLMGDDVLAPLREQSYGSALAHFVRCVTEGRSPNPSLADGYRSLAVIAAAEESARTGCLVQLSDFLDANSAG